MGYRGIWQAQKPYKNNISIHGIRGETNVDGL